MDSKRARIFTNEVFRHEKDHERKAVPRDLGKTKIGATIFSTITITSD
jgi:hypothetical protein